MLASPSPFHPQQMASSMLHHPESTPSDRAHPPPGLLGFRPLGQDQRLQVMQDNDEEDLNGSDMDSDIGSENEDLNDIDSEKLDASHKEILEKLKRQEQEEREEIERELKEAQREALANAQRHEEIRAHELRALEEQERAERGLEEMMGPLQTEIKMQRPLGLLAQHGLKSRAHLCERDRETRSEKTGKDSPSREKEKFHEKDTDNPDRDRPLSFAFDRDRPLPLSLPLPRPDLDFPHPAFLDSRGFGPPSHPESPRSIGTPGLDGSGSTGAQTPAGHHWTFEEQFKQLYELSDDPKRREFLDDLFCYMQKRGTPVNRIPIMAKQTLDLYELFRLVVSKGGLVEVINKKLWREITKGLNLPSSITSAAFTLRTQYMKYLYPYECEKLKLSNPAELQAAIDGNRREGRRPSYGYDFSPIPTMIPTPPGPHLNGGFHHGHPFNGRPNPGTPPKDEDHLLGSLHMANLAERDARAMEAAARAMEEATKRMEEARVSKLLPVTSIGSKTSSSSTPPGKLPETLLGQPPLKRPLLDEERFMAHLGMPSTHLKITSRGDGRNEFDNSMVVSMEINGIMYQGVLFAQHGHPRRI